MDTRAKIIDFTGKLLLCWFVFEGIHFLSTGRFMDLARGLPQFFQNRITLGLSVVFHMMLSTIGVLALIPLLLKGRSAGLILGLAIRLAGYTISPLIFVIPASALLSANNEPTILNHVIDIFWLIVTLVTIILFFLQRRAPRNA
jgi:hypothetical protein